VEGPAVLSPVILSDPAPSLAKEQVSRRIPTFATDCSLFTLEDLKPPRTVAILGVLRLHSSIFASEWMNYAQDHRVQQQVPLLRSLLFAPVGMTTVAK
jgi:hypothetical protein